MVERRRVLQGLGSVLALAAPGLASRPAFPAGPPYLTFGLPAGVTRRSWRRCRASSR